MQLSSSEDSKSHESAWTIFKLLKKKPNRRSSRKKSKAEIPEILAKETVKYQKVIDQPKTELSNLNKAFDSYNASMAKLESEIQKLKQVIINLELTK